MTAAPRVLPERLRRYFWEHDWKQVSWEKHRDFIVERIIARGDWESIRWIRSHAGDEVVREVILRTHGRSLTRPQLRFWELILGLPGTQVSTWLDAKSRRIWDRRRP
ncbi:MAG: hypothetical protein L0Z55_12185 [Planctomycetes bacterium]|nr:hypothetical protein [Planctomycetota bacterium]